MIEHNWEKIGNMVCVLSLKLGRKERKMVVYQNHRVLDVCMIQAVDKKKKIPKYFFWSRCLLSRHRSDKMSESYGPSVMGVRSDSLCPNSKVSVSHELTDQGKLYTLYQDS